MTLAIHRTAQTTPQFFNSSTSGDNTVVAAAAGQTTRVHRLHLTAAAAVTVQVKNGVGGTVIDTFQFVGTAPLPIVLDFSEEPYYETSLNTALVLNLSAAVVVTGQLSTITSA